MRQATMVCAEFPDVRCGRITNAMLENGWEHDAYTRGYPPQMKEGYTAIDWNPYRTDFSSPPKDSELYHVHGEMHHYFPVAQLKEVTDKPVILNVHDLTCARLNSVLDIFEEENLALADAHVWVTEAQRDYAKKMGLDVDKPYCIVPNYVSSRYFIDKTPLPHKGGLVYEGGIAERGNNSNYRDFSPIADEVELHIFGGGGDCDYGILEDPVMDYEMLFHRLAQYDWGLAGFYEDVPGWNQTQPTKAYEYLAAGIPIISWNTPMLDEIVDMGMGVTVNSMAELKKVVASDPKPYKKRVLEHRRHFCIERHIQPLVDLYEGLTHV